MDEKHHGECGAATRQVSPERNASAGQSIAGAAQSLSAPRSMMEQEIAAGVRSLRDLFGRVALLHLSGGIEHNMIVKAKERLAEAEMWAKRAIS